VPVARARRRRRSGKNTSASGARSGVARSRSWSICVDVGPVARPQDVLHAGLPHLVGRREPVLARHLPDGEPQPGARPQRWIVLRLRLSGHAPRAPFSAITEPGSASEARSGPGGATRATSFEAGCRPEFRGLPPPLDAAHSLRPQPGTPRLPTWPSDLATSPTRATPVSMPIPRIFLPPGSRSQMCSARPKRGRVRAPTPARPRHRHHHGPAQAHPDLRGLTPDSSLQRCRVRRGRVRAAPGGGAGPESSPPAGTGSASCRRASSRVPTRPRSGRPRTHDRCSRRRRDSSRWQSTSSTLRWRGLRSAMWHPPGIVLSTRTLWQPTIASSSSGPRTARRTSRTAPRWSEPRSRASMAGSEAMRLYERAIAAHDERLRPQRGTRERACRGFLCSARLRGHRASLPAEARNGYLLWGARARCGSSINFHPHLGAEQPAPDARRTIGVPIEHLDLATVLKVSEAVVGRDRAREADRHFAAHRRRARRRRTRATRSGTR